MKFVEVSPDAQGMLEMFDALDEIRRRGVLMSGKACAELAVKAIAKAERLRLEARPIPIADISAEQAGATINQPTNALYTLAILADGDAKVWKSERVATAEQHSYVYEGVMQCASALLGSAAGPSGLN